MAKPLIYPHRIMISLTDETHATLKALADLDGKPVASLVREFMEQLSPTLKATVEAVAKAKAGLTTEALLGMLKGVNDLQDKAGVVVQDVTGTLRQLHKGDAQ